MFEKYKKMMEQKNRFGLSKKEYRPFVFMILALLVCFVVIFLFVQGVLAPPAKKKEAGTEAKIEKQRGEPADRKKAFNKLLKKRLAKQKKVGAEEDFEIKEQPIPPPPAQFVEEPKIYEKVDDNAVDVLEEDVLYYALHQINSLTPEQITANVERDDDINPINYKTHPQNYRGKFVRITGTLMDLANMTMDTNRSGITQFWYGALYNSRHKRFHFYIIDKDREYRTVKNTSGGVGDLVTLEGVFVKMYKCTSENERYRDYVPFIVGRRLKSAKSIKTMDLYPWQLMFVLCGIIVAIFAIIYIAFRRDVKKGDQFLTEMRKQRPHKVDNEYLRAISSKKGKQKARKEESRESSNE